jgi:hypothetical protein
MTLLSVVDLHGLISEDSFVRDGKKMGGSLRRNFREAWGCREEEGMIN